MSDSWRCESFDSKSKAIAQKEELEKDKTAVSIKIFSTLQIEKGGLK